MYVLLSSAATKRYRDDILRCMAAPVGAQIQFRYGERLVGESIKSDIKGIRNSLGVVCNVNIDVKLDAKGTHPLTPVRGVIIERVWTTGSTISISIIMGEFAHAQDINRFTTQASLHSGGQTPANADPDAEGGEGLWFFQIPTQPDTLSLNGEISTFERITMQLCDLSHLKKEPFFWTVLGLRQGLANSIEERIDFNKVYTLLIYVFCPRGTNQPDGIGQLLVQSGLILTSLRSPEIVVDAPYDVKRWPFKVNRPSVAFRDSSWLRIGQEVLRADSLKKLERRERMTLEEIDRELRRSLSGSMDWEIDLPLQFRFSWLRVAWINLVLGALLAAPFILVIWQQTGCTDASKAISSLFALFFGFAAALVATFTIKGTTG